VRQVLALVGVLALAAALLGACGGGSADTEEVGARKAACNNAPDFALKPSRTQPDLVAFRPGALPPEPVAELLPKARFVIQASVARVLYQGEKPDRETHQNVAGPIPPDRCQVVQLDVTRVISGVDPGSSVTVVKPLAPYLLKAGQPTSDVAFIVEAGDPFPIILGRYGPYPVAEVEAALGTGQ
jgi:hypothetical protein